LGTALPERLDADKKWGPWLDQNSISRQKMTKCGNKSIFFPHWGI
jgi:hypothetical protein